MIAVGIIKKPTESNGSSQESQEITKSELDNLISTNTLIVGATYKITGVEPALYGGTTVWLLAVENNKLAPDGVGKFYTPKYEIAAGNGIWNANVECGVFDIVGDFDYEESVVANNGATGTVFGMANCGIITPISGNWATATTITGTVTGATARLDYVSVPNTYAIGDTTIWGGYHWVNLTGNIGSKTDDFTLDTTNWQKVTYNDTDYNVHYDEITYDFENDFITARKDNLGNDFKFSYKDYVWFYTMYEFDFNPIKYFQWGNNGYSYDGGVFDNSIKGAVVNIINFRGSSFFGNTFAEGSRLYNNTFAQESRINYVTFGQDVFIHNTIFGRNSNINNTTFEQFANLDNSFFGYYSIISTCSFKKYTAIHYVVFYNNTSISNVILQQYSSIDGTIIKERSYLNGNTFGQNSYLSKCTIPPDKRILNTVFENGCAIEGYDYNTDTVLIDFTAATVIFDDYSKTVYQRADGTPKIRYYNNSDVLVIADIQD